MSARICLDPGHGGWDPGAIAVDGRPEKEFTLDLTLAVRDELTRRFECDVVMTRDSDKALTPNGDLGAELRARAEVGNQAGADLFLSLHHDSASSPDARGGSLWIWRNHPESGVGHRPAIDPTTGQPTHDAPRSHEMGVRFIEPVRDRLAAFGIPWRSYGSPSGISAADFGVLRHSKGPGLLLECFFGSAAEDLAIARRPDFVSGLAAAIAAGVAAALRLPAAAPALVLNNVRHEGYQVVEGRIAGPLRPLLDELQFLGYRYSYDWRTRTLTVTAPARNVAPGSDDPDV